MSENIEIYKSPTFKLFKERQSFLNGFLSIVDDRESLLAKYNTKDGEKQADQAAIYSDWEAVAQDISITMKKYNEQQEQEQKILTAK